MVFVRRRDGGAVTGLQALDMPARVILGVSAGIAVYKSWELLRRLTESGHQVRVVPTADSLHFVGAATWAALSGQPVTTTPFQDVHEVPHVRLGGERPRRRPAHLGAADRALPRGVRARHAYRDVGTPGHPGQRGHPARAWLPGA